MMLSKRTNANTKEASLTVILTIKLTNQPLSIKIITVVSQINSHSELHHLNKPILDLISLTSHLSDLLV
jgi:hypothetical protein